MIRSINIDAYPKLRHAVVEIAYDNGCVNRATGTEAEIVENAFDALAASFDHDELERVNRFLAMLPAASFDRLCTGEYMEPESDIEQLVENVLNHAFENLL